MYWFLSYEQAGFVMLLFMGLASSFIGGYLLWKMGRVARPEDDPDAEHAASAGVVAGRFSAGSIWPLVMGLGLALAAQGLVFGRVALAVRHHTVRMGDGGTDAGEPRLRIQPLVDPPRTSEPRVVPGLARGAAAVPARGPRRVVRRADGVVADRTVSSPGPPDRERLRARVERSGCCTTAGWTSAIEVDGRLVGEIGTYGEVPGRDGPSGTYFFGIGLFDPADRGRGLGTDATRALCEWLFREGGRGARRDLDRRDRTHAMRGVFERLGFHFDGVERRWDVDWANYSVDRDAWPED